MNTVLPNKITISPIPSTIFQTSTYKQPQYVVDLITSKCVGWKYEHFNEKEKIKYMTDNSINDFPLLVDIYTKIVSVVQKNDLFKYVFLYVNGGVFLDYDSMLECNIDDVIKQYEFVTIASAVNPTSIYNGFIASSSKSPIIYAAIKYIYENEFSVDKPYSNNLHDVISSIDVKINSKIYTERVDGKIAYGYDDTETKFLTHYFIDRLIPNALSVKPKNKPINQLKVGVTMDLPKDALAMFSNGIRQNALYFYSLLNNIGYDTYLLVNNSIERESVLTNLFGLDKTTLKYIDMLDVAQQTTFDIIFQLSIQVPIDTIHKLRKCGVKIISYKAGNDYIFQMESALFGVHADIPGCITEHSLFDQIWSIPQLMNTNKYYWETIQRCECVEVPFIWSPMAIEQFEASGITQGTFTDVQYKNRGSVKKIAIFEPNLNVVKWSFPAILVCENAYRSIPEKIDKVYATNVPEDLKGKLNKMVKPLNVFKDNKLSAESRYNTMFFMSKYTDVAVSHQWENPLNYLYLDLAWMGWPIVHNAELCKDIGYYYEGFNYEMGGKVLTDVILNHDKHAAEYLKRNRKLIDRYLPTNKELQQKYIQLINDLFL